MKKFLVVWRGDEDEFMQSCVELGDIIDARQMTNNDWAYEAALSEGYEPNDASTMIERGYELILVCDMPENFYEQ